jgi:hypothetical protein
VSRNKRTINTSEELAVSFFGVKVSSSKTIIIFLLLAPKEIAIDIKIITTSLKIIQEELFLYAPSYKCSDNTEVMVSVMKI